MALYGNDIDDTVTPLEANLAWIVKLPRATSSGRDALVRQKEQGVPRKLVGFTTSERGVPAPRLSGRCATAQPSGVVCSGTMSPTLERARSARATCRRAHAKPGSELEIEIRGKRVPATVVKTPFYKDGRHL